MRRTFLAWLVTGILVLSFAVSAGAVVYDSSVSPDVIFGSGNANGFFVVDSSNNIETGLRAKIPYQGVYNSDGTGTYSFASGAHPKWGTPGAGWNFEFSVNVDVDGTTGSTLDDFSIMLDIDTDAGLGQNWTSFNPFLVFADNALGFYNTANGAGAYDPTANVNYGDYSVGQNSMNIGWLGIPFDSSIAGTYDFRLGVFDVASSNIYSQTYMTVEIDGGAAPVPEPSTILLLGGGLLGLGWYGRKRKK